MKVMGTKYQVPFAIVVGREEELLKFGSVENIFVHNMLVYFEFIPMITEQYHHHFHTYALAMSPANKAYLIKHNHLIDFHPYGLYHSTSISSNSNLQYVVMRSNIYNLM